MERKSCCYWVKIFEDSVWQTAHYNSKSMDWLFFGVPNSYKDEFIFKINENRIMSPDEWE